MEEITEQQRQRAEANRLAALAKRKALSNSTDKPDPWALFKCQKISHQLDPAAPLSAKHPQDLSVSHKFRVKLEICSPDSFSLAPEAIQGFPYPGQDECLRTLADCLSNVMSSHYTQNHGGERACVYKLGNYEAVLRCLKSFKCIEVEDVPFATLNVIERLSHSFVAGQWMPCRPEHLSYEKVEELIGKLPKTLSDALLPFQLDGVRFGLQRGGRCLIADEMGLGKTLQAIAIACCFMNEGSILVVCPAILRYSWAEELERWLPICLPGDIHLVFGHRNNPAYLKRCPRVVVISYTMLHRLRKSMLEQEWALLIVDESHHVRTSKKTSESEEIKAVLDMATKVKRIVLLSGTPSLSRPFDIFHQINMLWPGLLGKTKYEFAKTYCDVKSRICQGKVFQDFSKGIRLEELNVLLKQTVMIRRLKENVLHELPPKRRQIIRLLLKKSDIVSAKVAAAGMKDAAQDTLENSDEPEYDGCGTYIRSEKLSYQELGIAKLNGFREWISLHPLITQDGAAELDLNPNSHKMIIFAHHLKVLDGVQEFLCEKEIQFVRIDGNTLARDRQSAVQSFQSSSEVKIAIIGITAGGVGLNFSSAQHVVFLELPQSPSLMLQAEDRAHRRGQTNAVNIYIFCAKDTMDESHWQNLNKSLRCVSSTTNGKYDAVKEIAVEGISYLETSGRTDGSCQDHFLGKDLCGESSAEPTLIANSGLALGIQSSELLDEIAGKGNDVSEIELQNSSLKQKLEEYISESLVTNSDRVSSSKWDMDCEDKDQPGQDCNFYQHNGEINDGPLVQPLEADTSFFKLANSLRFEVSQYTGRIHLYSCIPGKDLRPCPLFENFRPEELESRSSPNANDNNQKTASLKDDPTCRHAILEFLKEWNQLRPVEKRRLLGKPLQLPLTAELCYLKESANHNSGGLLHGGSKRRTTPLCEISNPLPSNAVWKEVRVGSGNGKKEKEYTQAWSVTDEPLCKLCQTPCTGNNAKKPEFFEDLFCNLGCYEEYRLRTSNRFLRQELFEIEHGVCTNCQLDCHQLVKHLKPLSLERRRSYIEKIAPRVASRKTLLDKLVNDPSEGNAWHADHIVPVYLGGGECRLENMRTLCVACHSDVTAAQCTERRSARAKARKQLKAIMKNLRNGQSTEVIETNLKEEDNIAEDELIVRVPGSAYSGDQK